MTTGSNPPHILLVEDNQGEVELIKEALSEDGVECSLTVLENGKDALDYLIQRNDYQDAPAPDLMILDLNLPKVDGLKVMELIDRHHQLRRIPTIIHTSSCGVVCDEAARRNKNRQCHVKGTDLASYTALAKRVTESFAQA